MEKPKVGDQFFIVDIGNRARTNPQQRYCEVVKVGRKYFYVTGEFREPIQFCLERHRQVTDYCEDYALFESEKAWRNSVEAIQWARLLHESFSWNNNKGHSLEQLRAVGEILGIALPVK